MSQVFDLRLRLSHILSLWIILSHILRRNTVYCVLQCVFSSVRHIDPHPVTHLCSSLSKHGRFICSYSFRSWCAYKWQISWMWTQIFYFPWQVFSRIVPWHIGHICNQKSNFALLALGYSYSSLDILQFEQILHNFEWLSNEYWLTDLPGMQLVQACVHQSCQLWSPSSIYTGLHVGRTC